MSDTKSVYRSGRMLPSILMAGGLTAAAWLLGAVLSTSASAEEAPDTTSSASATVESTTPHAEVAKVPTAKPAALSKEEPAPAETFSVQSKTPEPTPRKKSPAAQHSGGGGLLGGLLGTVLNVVTNTVSTVTNVVDDVLTPGPQVDPDCPEPLPLNGVGKAILPIFGNDQPTHSGSSATASVTATRPAADQAATAATAPENPPAAPETPTAARVSTVVNQTAHLAQTRQPAEKTAKSDQQAGVKAGGSSGGGQLPTAPSAPLTPTGTVTAGHDSGGGARHQLAVLTSDTNTTQLRLIGTSLDHEVDGAGRDAALPTTSPD
ncbi:hypothetical protein AB5J62_01145 [Amycolatopsis sp. cg5]|uniref:hypothetical protein n=1 Tax=Amycolatopsis sp. cg5 TaxID=3238802 RepID=UPI003523D17D